jgi:hypothetical protein
VTKKKETDAVSNKEAAPKRVVGKPFEKGSGVDPRINRAGVNRDGESWASLYRFYWVAC